MSGRRVLVLYGSLLLGFAVVLCRLFWLCSNTAYAARAEAQSTATLMFPARRGNFYDCNSHLLTGLGEQWLALSLPGEGSYTKLYPYASKAGQAMLYQKRNASRPFLVEVTRDVSAMGAGCYAAAVALKDYLIKEKKDGTVIFFGCPAEEGAGSKQFIARAGYFDNVDFAYTWHPETVNEVGSRGSVAIMGANFTFDGIAAHAGGEPHLGRSALDAVELMNVGCNYLREHMIDAARIHYAYSDPGGTAPNVVQSHAVIKYEVRAPKVSQVQELFTRVVDVARGAALMTGTKMKYEITMAFSDYVPNRTLGAVVDQCMRELGAPEWTEPDYRLAAEFLRTYPRTTMVGIREKLGYYFEPEELDAALEKPLDRIIHPFNPKETAYSSGSTDVGDVGYATPTVMFHVATACLGNVGHSWQNTAFACSDIGMKGMLRAAEIMTLAAIRTMDQPAVIAKAREELKQKNGGSYHCPLPDYVTPPIGRY